MATLTETALTVMSTAFREGGDIPMKYSCEGENINPPLDIKGLPSGTKTLAIITEDPDTGHGVFDHWLVWNIPPNKPVEENNAPGVYGKNDFGNRGYGGPCPPKGKHRYFFYVYALDAELDLPPGSTKAALKRAMEGHILAVGELMGYYMKLK
jgi:Raf kinase inhibitor-like YbhB/YbcL family protein